MKKFILIPAFFASLSIIGCKEENEIVIQEVPVEKSVTYNVSQSQNYENAMYNNLNAEVKLTISKEDLKAVRSTILWDTVMVMKNIREYPTMNNPLIIQKSFKNILESKESIRISRSIRYSFNNQISLNALGEFIPTYSNSMLVVVGL